MGAICHIDNLSEAFLRAVRGKAGKRYVRRFRACLHENLQQMGCELEEGTFRFGDYHFFCIYDPKPRTICAASFRERVAFHAMMRICHPVFDNYQISDSYASRVGKGTYKALERSVQFCRRYRWFLKLDVCKYFDSIDHEVLYGQLCRLFKDRVLLGHFRRLIDSYQQEEGHGLPIGNLTSQYFANHYLSVADHYLKEYLHVPAMVRYMDDVVLFGNDRRELLSVGEAYRAYLHGQLLLQLHEPVMNECRRGLPFLGYVVRPSGLRLNQRSRHRFCVKQRRLNEALERDEISDMKYRERMGALCSFIDKADVEAFKRRYVVPEGLSLNLRAPIA